MGVSRSEHETDVLIVGSGAAGLVASLRAHARGLRTLVVEKSEKIGGASAYSGGGLWIPDNHVSKAAGLADSFEEALTYMESIIGDAGPASSRERKVAFLENGPRMVRFLEELGFRWVAAAGYADYYPDKPGGKELGRGIEGRVFDARRLGEWRQHLLMNPLSAPVPIYTAEVSRFVLMVCTLRGFFTAVWVLLVRMLGRRLLGQIPMTNGKSLVGQLLLLNLRRKLPIWRSSPMLELVVQDGRVVGAVVEREGQRIAVRASRGVLLCAGGFAKNQEMRETFEEAPVSVAWSSVPPGDTGDAIRAGVGIGAATALMDDAWWGPTLVDPASGKPSFILWERSCPHSIIVDASGSRFMNEAESYVDAGHHQYERNRTVPAIPAWLVVDARHRRRYLMASLPPGSTPKSAIHSGFIVKADSLDELARKIGVDPGGLAKTVARFNEMARRGVDEDFGRGRTAYDRLYGDPSNKPHPNLGTIERAPFYASKVFPGDLGTKGGLLTDEHARVLRTDGTPIPGLYAAGNSSASVMGRSYAGPGATLGPATTFAYIAADRMATG